MSRELIWTTNDVPVHFTEDGEDKGVREISTTITNGSVFRVVEYEPGVTPRNQLHASTCFERSIGQRLPMDILVARNSLGKPQTVS
jgi:hypothetical protein